MENLAIIEVPEYLFLCLRRLALILITLSQKCFCTVQLLNLRLRQFNVTMGNEILFTNLESLAVIYAFLFGLSFLKYIMLNSS